MVALRNFTARAGAGRDALEAMKRDNRAAYPELAAELTGIAAGARVPAPRAALRHDSSTERACAPERAGPTKTLVKR